MSDFDAAAVAARFLQPEELDAAGLASYRLSTVAHSHELWRDVTSTANDLERAILASRDAGRLPPRRDPGFRTWDLHAVIGEIGRHSAATLSGPQGDARVRLRAFERPPGLRELDETWWTAAEGCRIMHRRVFEVRVEAPGVSALGGHDPLSPEERGALDDALGRRWRAVAESLPADPHWWLQRLRLHASLVLRLRRADHDGPARLCAAQLESAQGLALLRLDLPYRELRRCVGTLNDDLTMPALTAASYSHLRRAGDAALDLLLEHVAEAQPLVGSAVVLDESSCDRFLGLLDEVGLQGWYSELMTIGWGDHFIDMSLDQRRAVVHGRVRTLAALTEEMLPVLASHAAGLAAGEAVTKQAHLSSRLEKLMSILAPAGPSWTTQDFQRFGTSASPPFTEKALRAPFAALGIASRSAITPPLSLEALLAALVLVRNLAAHRFPGRGDASAAAWGQVFADVLPGINRRLVVAALVLWGLAEARALARSGHESVAGPGKMTASALSSPGDPPC
jgi:hypothetical protein